MRIGTPAGCGHPLYKMNPKLFKNFTVASSIMCTALFILWGTSLFCFEMRLDFPIGKTRYCEVACFLGTMDLTVTRYYGTPCIIKRFQEDDPGMPKYACDYMPPHGAEFYSQWVSLKKTYPRILSWFSLEQDSVPDAYHFKSIETPYWFFAMLFSILPAIWLVRLKKRPLNP